VAERDLKGLLKFCAIAEIKESFVVCRGDERSIGADGVRIEIVPVSKFFIMKII